MPTFISRSVSRKLSLMLFSIMLAFALSSAFFSYQGMRSQYIDNVKTIHETNELMATLLSSYIVSIRDSKKTPAELLKDENYIALAGVLDSMVKKELVENAYVFSPDIQSQGGKDILNILVTNTSLSGLQPPKSPYTLPDAFKKAVLELDKLDVALTDTYRDDSGVDYISTLSKVRDDKGNTLAIFGLDFKYDNIQTMLAKEIFYSFGFALLLGILFSVLSWFAILKQLAPLKELTEATNRAAHGDFSFQVPVTRQDDFGRLKQYFNSMLVNVAALLNDVAASSQTAVSASRAMQEGSTRSLDTTRQMAHAVQEIAAGAELQQHSTAETKRAIEEMAVGVQRIAESAGDVTEQVFAVAEETGTNQKLMAQTVEQMERINESVHESEEKLERLLERSSDISGIVSIISDIANQTNLLSLNASIEAARAGEHGRGFAIVAGEIRKLAEQSQVSSQSIAELIGGITQDTDSIATSMRAGAQEATSGAEIVRRTYDGFERIAGSVRQITSQVEEISAATEQLSASSEEISATMEELSRISRQAAANAQEAAASVDHQVQTMDAMTQSVEELSASSDKVNEGLSKFTI
ncbi:HAMP domain-containing methyl-accepting chemotaxis protein [Paenibacillus filicis]|uniref:HAMP domain-containing methyl-accepting chemotaxis protein n=1 Tax=Paenibacillus filicis TaxID=669464 RepID=A0ABU9DWB8_9BACL